MILLAGSTGYVGSAIAEKLTASGLPWQPLLRSHFAHGLDREFTSADVVINAAGFSGLAGGSCDLSENQQELELANVTVPCALAEFSQANGAVLFHVSTGGVFPSKGHAPDKEWEEDEVTTVRGAYLQSKLRAEAVVSQYDKHFTLRIGMPFDTRIDHPRNLLNQMLGKRYTRNAMNSLTYLPDLSSSIVRMIQDGFNQFGTYHVASTHPVSTARLSTLLAANSARSWGACSVESLLSSAGLLSTRKLDSTPYACGMADTCVRYCVTHARIL